MSAGASGSRPCLYLVATTGHPNYGDELVCASWLRHLARTAPDADVWVDCHSPGLSQLLLGDLHPRVRFVDTLWRMCWAAPDDPAAAAEFVAGAVRRAGTVAAMDAGRPLLLHADVLHVVGGGFLNTVWPRHYGLLAGIVEAAHISGARTGLTGQGLLPLGAGADEVVRELAATLTVCDVRDQPSQQLLSGVTGPRLSATGDDLFLGFSRDLFDTRDSPDVMVCAQSDMLDHPLDQLTELLGRVLEAWEVEPHQVGWVESIPSNDRHSYNSLEERLPGMRFYPFMELWEQGLPARPGQRWLATRFHPHLMAAAAGCWGVAVSVRSGYYDVKHESLIAQGSGWGRLSLGTLPAPADVPQPPEGASDFRRRVEALGVAKRQVAEALYPPPGP